MSYVPDLKCVTYPKQPKQPNKNKEERSNYYGTKSWQNLRNYKLMNNPFCQVHEIRKTKQYVPATQVHHLNSFMNGVTDGAKLNLFSDFNNLCSICGDCHSKYHRYCQNNNLTVNHTVEEIADILDDLEIKM